MKVISASRREDIPAFRMPMFMESFRAKSIVYSMGKANYQVQIEDGDFFVFWTKNPGPAIQYLPELKSHPMLWQVTCNSYGVDMEPHVPPKGKVIIPAIKELSRQLGPQSVVWRYDPICINDTYTVQEHAKRFEMLAQRLAGTFNYCTISFVDIYGKLAQKLNGILRAPTTQEINDLCGEFASTASKYGFEIRTCAEKVDLARFNIKPGKCIDPQVVANISGQPIPNTKDPSQRSACGCMPSIDIGNYRQCKHGCLYCYAN